MSVRQYLAAAVQLCAGSDKRDNLDRAEGLVVEAARQGARLVVLPEVFTWRGDRAREAETAEAIPGPTTQRCAGLARRLGIHLVAGSILEKSDAPHSFNTSLLFGPDGSELARYRKLHLFDVDIPGQVTVRESATRRPGSSVVAADTELGRIGLTICYDLRFPELYRALTRDGAEIIAIPSAFTLPTGAAHWEILVRARAIENQVYVVAADQIGASPSGVVDFGHSLIVDPWGTPIARAPNRQTVLLAQIDRDDQQRVRRELPCLKHQRLPVATSPSGERNE